jgi:hypothetical protein
MRKSALRLIHLGSLIVGLALFAFLIYRTGLEALAHYLKLTGWGFAGIIALSALRNLARAASWYFAIAPQHRTIGFWLLINVMLAGEAIKYLTSTGPFVGEPAKAAMVRHHVPLMHGLSSVFVENLIYYTTVIFFMFVGLPALAMRAELPEAYHVTGYAILAVLLLSIAAIWVSVRRRLYPLARATAALAARWPEKKRLGVGADGLREIEASLYEFYAERKGAFAGLVALNMGAHLLNVLEVCVILALFGLPASLAIGLVMEAATKVVNLIFFFMPTQPGVYESAHALVIAGLGMTSSAGLALGVVRKLRAFFWAGYGLVALAILARLRTAEQNDQPRGD